MTPSSTLRDRRRMQTEREIQVAALRIALRDGYEAVTTEMIAAEAGISLRTFFNYYPNKEAAIVGRRPEFGDHTLAWFRTASGPLVDDLFEALRQLLQDKQPNRDTTRMVDALLSRMPDLVAAFHASLQILKDQMADLAVSRLGEEARDDAEMIAEMVAHATANAFRRWAHDETMDADDLVRVARQQVVRVGEMISRRSS